VTKGTIVYSFIPVYSSQTVKGMDSCQLGETGVYWDTGSKGTVRGKIVDVNKIKKKLLVCY
jgi:hypothetical protein